MNFKCLNFTVSENFMISPVNVWPKLRKTSKIGQDQKTLISAFALGFDCYLLKLILGGKTGL